jgi:peptidoglycan/xylan/chitin deacetylase (PgdA/CDA1 family)/head-tail adaptor
MSGAGSMYHRVQFYSKVIVRDDYGSSNDTWPTVTISTRGELRHTGGNRELSNEEKFYAKNIDLVVRYRSNIVETMRVRIDGTKDLYLINYIEPLGRKEKLRITLEKINDALSVTLVEAPTLFDVSLLNPTTARLTWVNNSDADPIIIQRCTDGVSWEELVRIESGVATYDDEDLLEDVTYSYRICAYKYYEYSAFSDVDTFLYSLTYLDILNDGNTLAWYDASDLTTITKDGSQTVTRWNDKLGSGHDLSTGSCTYDAVKGIMTFNGSTEYLKSDAWSGTTQPYKVYMVVRQVDEQINGRLFDGYTGSDYCSIRATTGGLLRQYAAVAGGTNGYTVLGAWSIIECLFDGANSYLKVDDTAATVSNAGTRTPGGFTLAANAGLNYFGKLEVAEIILRKAADSATYTTLLRAHLKEKLEPYRFDKGKIFIGWDGDLKTIYNAYSILAEHSIPSTLYLCTKNMQESTGVDELSWDQVATMVAAGADVQCHGYEHIKITEYTEAQLLADFASMDANITAHGYTAQHVAYPFGTWGTAAIKTVADVKLSGRAITKNILSGVNVHPHILPGYEIIGAAGEEEAIMANIDRVAEDKSCLILYCHGISTTSPTIEYFQRIIDYAVTKDVDFINHSQLYELLDIEYPYVFKDGHTIGAYNYTKSNNITFESTGGSPYVKTWAPFAGTTSITNPGLWNPDAILFPSLTADGILFDGVRQYLGISGLTLPHPVMIHMVLRNVSYTNNDVLIDGASYLTNMNQVRQSASNTTLRLYTAAGNSTTITCPALGTFFILRVYWNGADTYIQVNNGTKVTWAAAGSTDLNGFYIGSRGPGNGSYSNIEVKGLSVRNSILGDSLVYDYFNELL